MIRNRIKKNKIIFQIITIFPDIFDSYFNESIIKRAKIKKLIDIIIHDLRNWATDKHKTVDDKPFGGGVGMLLKIEPIIKALDNINTKKINKKRRIILLSAKGKTFDQQMAEKYAKMKELIFICPRYEGVDERILNFIDDEVSIGDYVMTGGELPAMVIIDSVIRLIPGVLGNSYSIEDESHSIKGLLEYPQYTRPEILNYKGKKYKVPEVLLSGNHKKIFEWKSKKIKKI